MTEETHETKQGNTLFYGLAFVFLGILILAGALRAINPPEGALLPDTPPTPVDGMGLLQFVTFAGFVGLIISTASILVGIILVIVGFRKQEQGYDVGLRDSFRVQWASGLKFKLFFIFTLVWAMAWLFNTLSAPRVGPLEFPLYFVREPFLRLGMTQSTPRSKRV